MVDLNPALLQSKGLSPADVVTALGNQQNLILPCRHRQDRPVRIRRRPERQPEARWTRLNDLPIKQVGNSTIYVRDVAHCVATASRRRPTSCGWTASAARWSRF